jgi:pimeloyl-ACP methyl ester carboxylesterase
LAALMLSACATTTAPTAAPGIAAESADAPDPAVTYANVHAAGTLRSRESYVGSGDARLHYVEVGQGPLVILYHGFPSYWFSWYDQMELLKPCYRVVALDAPGAGLSAKPRDTEPYRVETLAAQLDSFAQHLAPGQRFTLVGHDWGGALAWSYAQAYPERLNQLVVMSAPPYNLFIRLAGSDGTQQARSGYMQRFRAISYEQTVAGNVAETLFTTAYAGLAADGSLSDEELALFRGAVAQPAAAHGGMNWYRANIMDFAAMESADPWPGRSATTPVPTLLVWGDDDQTFVPAMLDLAPAYAANLRIVRLPGVGHWASMQQPERANADIADVLMPGGRCPSA